MFVRPIELNFVTHHVRSTTTTLRIVRTMLVVMKHEKITRQMNEGGWYEGNERLALCFCCSWETTRDSFDEVDLLLSLQTTHTNISFRISYFLSSFMSYWTWLNAPANLMYSFRVLIHLLPNIAISYLLDISFYGLDFAWHHACYIYFHS